MEIVRADLDSMAALTSGSCPPTAASAQHANHQAFCAQHADQQAFSAQHANLHTFSVHNADLQPFSAQHADPQHFIAPTTVDLHSQHSDFGHDGGEIYGSQFLVDYLHEPPVDLTDP